MGRKRCLHKEVATYYLHILPFLLTFCKYRGSESVLINTLLILIFSFGHPKKHEEHMSRQVGRVNAPLQSTSHFVLQYT